MSAGPPADLTVYSKWRSLIFGHVAAWIVVFVGCLGFWAAGGFRVLPLVIVLIGLTLWAIMLVDYPARCTFTADGIVRQAALRRQHLAWDDVSLLVRSPASIFSRFTPEAAGARGIGGLAAAVGRRRYLLASHAESRDEFDALLDLVHHYAPDVPISASRPTESVPPSWLYRRNDPRHPD